MEDVKKNWIQKGIDDDAIQWAEEYGKKLTGHQALTTSQLRKFFGEVKRISANFDKNQEDIPMLRPLLAYAAGRHGGKLKDFSNQISKALSYIEKSINKYDKKQFDNFIKLCEAIVAYHKFYEGK